jgi:hypothetical protein
MENINNNANNTNKIGYITFHYVWDNLGSIKLFEYIFENKKLNNIYKLYSCFNYSGNTYKIKQNDNNINIYYTGERFLDDLNSNITIGFLPSSIIYKNKKFENIDLFKLIENKKQIQIINSNYIYKNKELATINFPIKENDKKIYLQIRDQEREHLEYLINKNILDKSILDINKSSLKILKKNINIYKNLNEKWLDYGSRLTIENLDDIKPKFCCFIVSNPLCWERNEFFKLLCKYKNVDSYGKLFKNVDIITPPRGNKKKYYELISKYKFMITFENNSLDWYHTEKIYNSFQACTIPIYWGDPLIMNTYNLRTFIHIDKNDNKDLQLCYFTKAIDSIIYLDINKSAYINYFKYKPVINDNMEDERLCNNIYYLMNLK